MSDSNDYLGVTKEIRAETPYELDMKVREQLRKWEEKEKRERARRRLSDLKEQAAHETRLAQELLEKYRNILTATLAVDDRVNWKLLYDRKPFRSFRFDEKEPTYEAVAGELGVPPKSTAELLLPGRKAKRLALEEQAKRVLEERKREYENRRKSALEAYEKEKAEYEAQQRKHNEGVDQLRAGFERGEPECIEQYVRLVLEYSKYPEGIEKEFDVQFDPGAQTVVIDYCLPNPEQVPRIVEYRYSAKDNAVKPVSMKQKEFEAFYESTLYQIVLRTVHEVFEAVYIPHVQSVVFNGWVEGVDLATGASFRSCLVSLCTTREEFSKINLAKVDPKQCFRNLKGLSAGPLHNLAPVKPIMAISREDKRFVESRDVLAEVSSIPNLATMDWEDFEHLVRGLFEKVFAKEGGEVKVTRASRDWGVDAIAFDPDPIRGGKFVIQAKRYNNVVPVSAVRDLYGTMINEGAAKGILVTTSYFGSDSYEFVKEKPITLIDGSNLLYLFSQHGYSVRIDLQRKPPDSREASRPGGDVGDLNRAPSWSQGQGERGWPSSGGVPPGGGDEVTT